MQGRVGREAREEREKRKWREGREEWRLAMEDHYLLMPCPALACPPSLPPSRLGGRPHPRTGGDGPPLRRPRPPRHRGRTEFLLGKEGERREGGRGLKTGGSKGRRVEGGEKWQQ